MCSFWTKFEPFSVIYSQFSFEYIFFKKHEFLENFYFDKICSKIHKNELKYKLCTILEWDKCQQFADFIKFWVFRFALTQMCKTFVPFFMNQTLFCLHSFNHFEINFALLGSNIRSIDGSLVKITSLFFISTLFLFRYLIVGHWQNCHYFTKNTIDNHIVSLK